MNDFLYDDLAVVRELTTASQVFGPGSNSHPEDLLKIADGYLSLSTYTPDNENGGLTGILITKLGSDGLIDQSFGNEGSMTVYFEGFAAGSSSFGLLPNGSLFVSNLMSGSNSGQASEYHYGIISDPLIAGTPTVTTFAAPSPTSDQRIIFNDLVSIPDGLFVVGSLVDGYLSTSPTLTKIDTSGAVDSTFGTNGSVSIDVGSQFDIVGDPSYQGTSLHVMGDGSILVGGRATGNASDGSWVADTFLVKLQSDGTLDQNFATNGLIKNTAADSWDAVITASIDTVFMASTSGTNGHSDEGGVYHPGGSWIDISAFSSASGAEISRERLSFGNELSDEFEMTFGIKAAEGGGAFVYGFVDTYSGENPGGMSADGYKYDIAIFKLTSDGLLDSAFGTNGYKLLDTGVGYEYATDLVEAPGGDLLILASGNASFMEENSEYYSQAIILDSAGTPIDQINTTSSGQNDAVYVRVDESGRQFVTLDSRGNSTDTLVVEGFNLEDDVLDFGLGGIFPDQVQVIEYQIEGIDGALMLFDFNNDQQVSTGESSKASIFFSGISPNDLEAFRDNYFDLDTGELGDKLYLSNSVNPTATESILEFYAQYLIPSTNGLGERVVVDASPEQLVFATDAGGTVAIKGRDFVFSSDPLSDPEATILSGVTSGYVARNEAGEIIVDLHSPLFPSEASTLLYELGEIVQAQIIYEADPTEDNYANLVDLVESSWSTSNYFDALQVGFINASGLQNSNVQLHDYGHFSGSDIQGDDLNDVLIGSDFNDTIHGSYGNDVLTGGLGADAFIFEEFYGSIPADVSLFYEAGEISTDRITDFSLSEGDWIDFSRLFNVSDGSVLTTENINSEILDFDLDGTSDTVITVTDVRHWHQEVSNGDFKIVLEDTQISFSDISDRIIVDPSVSHEYFDATAWSSDRDAWSYYSDPQALSGKIYSNFTENLVREQTTLLDQTEILTLAEANGLDWVDISTLLPSTEFAKWGGDIGTPVSLTYSLANSTEMLFDEVYASELDSFSSLGGAEAYSQQSTQPGFELSPFSAEQADVIRASFDQWSLATGIEFTEVADSQTTYGDIRLVQLDLDAWATFASFFDGKQAFAYLPGEGAFAGDIFVDSDDYAVGDGFFEYVIAHEIGHALGLGHPHDGIHSSFVWNQESVMAYDDGSGYMADSPMQLDIDVASLLYGGSDISTDDQIVINLDESKYHGTEYSSITSVIDRGGFDSLSFVSTEISSDDNGIFIDLNPAGWGGFIDIETPDGETVELTEDSWRNDEFPLIWWQEEMFLTHEGRFYIDDQTVIEELYTTDGQDVIFTPSIDAQVDAGGGSDHIIHQGGSGTVYGGAGLDKFSLTHRVSEQEISGTVSGKVGAWVFVDVNRNGIYDADEPSGLTSSASEFTLMRSDTYDDISLVSFGGIDASTGLTAQVTLSAPISATVISPISTLVDAGLSVSEVKTILSLSISDSALLSFDPEAEMRSGNTSSDVSDFKAASTKIANILNVGAQLLEGGSGADLTVASDSYNITSALVDALVTEVQSVGTGAAIDFAANTTLIEDILNTAADNATANGHTVTKDANYLALTNALGTQIGSVNAAIDTAVTANAGDFEAMFTQIYKVEKSAISDLGADANGGVLADVSGYDVTTSAAGMNVTAAVILVDMPTTLTFESGDSGTDTISIIGFETLGINNNDGAYATKTATDPVYGANTVMDITRVDTSFYYAGAQIDLSGGYTIPFDASNTTLSLNFYSPEAGLEVRMEVADSASADDANYVMTTASGNTVIGWNTLEFDFSNPVARFVSAYGQEQTTELQNTTYDKINIFPNWGNGYNAPETGGVTGTALSADTTYYIDNVTFGSLTNSAFDGIVDFDDYQIGHMVFSDEGNASNPSISVVDSPTDAANAVAEFVKPAGSLAGFDWITFIDSDQDLITSGSETVTMKVYSPGAGKTVRLTLTDETTGQDVVVDASTTSANTWETLTFDFSNPKTGRGLDPLDHSNTYNQAKVAFGVGETTTDIYYFDEVEFSTDAGGGILGLDTTTVIQPDTTDLAIEAINNLTDTASEQNLPYQLRIADYQTGEVISIENMQFDPVLYSEQFAVEYSAIDDQTLISITTNSVSLANAVILDGEHILTGSILQADGDLELQFVSTQTTLITTNELATDGTVSTPLGNDFDYLDVRSLVSSDSDGDGTAGELTYVLESDGDLILTVGEDASGAYDISGFEGYIVSGSSISDVDTNPITISGASSENDVVVVAEGSGLSIDLGSDAGSGSDVLSFRSTNAEVDIDLNSTDANGFVRFTTVDGDSEVRSAEVILGSDGDDRIIGHATNDNLIHGYSGNDYIEGGSGNDILHGGLYDDTLIGGAGDDVLIDLGYGTADGGLGKDIFQVRGKREMVDLDGDGTTETTVGDGLDDALVINNFELASDALKRGGLNSDAYTDRIVFSLSTAAIAAIAAADTSIEWPLDTTDTTQYVKLRNMVDLEVNDISVAVGTATGTTWEINASINYRDGEVDASALLGRAMFTVADPVTQTDGQGSTIDAKVLAQTDFMQTIHQAVLDQMLYSDDALAVANAGGGEGSDSQGIDNYVYLTVGLYTKDANVVELPEGATEGVLVPFMINGQEVATRFQPVRADEQIVGGRQGDSYEFVNTEFTDDLGVPVADQGFGQDLILERGLRGADVSDDANRDKIEFADEVSNTGLSIEDLLVGELILDRTEIGREGAERSLDITYTGSKLNHLDVSLYKQYYEYNDAFRIEDLQLLDGSEAGAVATRYDLGVTDADGNLSTSGGRDAILVGRDGQADVFTIEGTGVSGTELDIILSDMELVSDSVDVSDFGIALGSVDYTAASTESKVSVTMDNNSSGTDDDVVLNFYFVDTTPSSDDDWLLITQVA